MHSRTEKRIDKKDEKAQTQTLNSIAGIVDGKKEIEKDTFWS